MSDEQWEAYVERSEYEMHEWRAVVRGTQFLSQHFTSKRRAKRWARRNLRWMIELDRRFANNFDREAVSP